MRTPWLALTALALVHRAGAVYPFVLDLEACIRNHAKRLGETFPQWGDKCRPATECARALLALSRQSWSPRAGTLP